MNAGPAAATPSADSIPARDRLPTCGLLSPDGDATAIPGFRSIAPGKLGDVDFVYAPSADAAMLTPSQLANVRLAIACHDLDFVLVSDGLQPLPTAAISSVRNHVVFRGEHADVFLEGRTPCKPLQGRVLNVPCGRNSPVRDLREVFGPCQVGYSSQRLSLGTAEAVSPSFRLAANVAWRDARPTKPVVFVMPILLAVGGVERNMIAVMQELRHLYDFVVITIERLRESQGSLHHQTSDSALGIYDFAEAADSEAFLSMFQALKAGYSPRLIWICNGATWLCDHAEEFRKVFGDTPIVDQEVYDFERGWIQRYPEPGIQSFDRFVAINRPIRRRFIEDFGMAADRVDLVYHAVDTERFCGETLSAEERGRRLDRFGLPAGRRLFAFVGRLTGQKRPLDFLELARREQERGGDDLFVMVGDGELSGDVQAFVERHRLKNVQRIPFCNGMAELLPLFSGIIFTSEFEGLPIAMLEALCMGVPALATDVGDIRYVLERFGNGRVVPTVGDAEVLHREFRIWQSNLAGYRAADAAPEVRAMFASQNIAQQYQDCWQRAMAMYAKCDGPHDLQERMFHLSAVSENAKP